ncbi:MAG TPA: hypothetical protein VK603_17985, partial [Candidatus Saccharimonadales bacterium]|nr:hypothetical protein [Candidatus Saccharimonadales bacterium]
MAKKNEILLSIALEGDEDVKKKLEGIGDSGKKLGEGKGFGELGKGFGEFGKGIEGAKAGMGELAGPLGKLREAFGPLIEGAGLGGILGGAGGLLGRLFGAAGPPAAIAALTGLAVHLAKVSEETEKTKSRLKALGAGDEGFEKLTAQAKSLGTDASSLQPTFEKALSYNR